MLLYYCCALIIFINKRTNLSNVKQLSTSNLEKKSLLYNRIGVSTVHRFSVDRFLYPALIISHPLDLHF
jgi:hypothetical protein